MNRARVVGLVASFACVGCATYSYHVDQDEARRALSETGGHDEVVVRATRTDSDEPVRLRLERTDRVTLTVRCKEGPPQTTTPEQLINLAPAVDTVEGLDFEETRRTAGGALAIGAPLALGSTFLGVVAFVTTPFRFGAVPVVGPLWFTSETGIGAAAALGVFQAVGIGLLTAGIIMNHPTHEVADEPDTRTTTFRWPMIAVVPSPGGGGAVQMVGAF
jgi:hypothetical protein